MALLLEIGRKWTVVVLAAIVGTFYEYLWTNQTSCKLSYDFEGKMLKNPSGFDGQKALCLEPEMVQKAGRYIVYSFRN